MLSCEGGRMGRGVSIQTQTITKPSKAARGRLCGSPFLGVFGSRAKSWSITSCAEKTGVGVSGPEARRPARRGVSDCGGGGGRGRMPTRVVCMCDSEARPPSRLGRVDHALWARAGFSGVWMLGAQNLQDVSHNGGFTEVSQAWNKTRRAPLARGRGPDRDCHSR